MQNELPHSVDTVARTAWGEARGCGQLGMHAVINVIMNRANHPRWWGKDAVSVCTEPYQFSCRDADDPNLPLLTKVTQADPEFRIAVELATQAMAGTLTDLTSDADSYYARSMRWPPAWASRARQVYADTWHAFFRLENPAPGTVTDKNLVGIPDAPNYHEPTADDLNQESLDGTLNI